MYDIKRFRRLSQALVHFVIDRASLFTDHRISGLPIRAKCYASISELFEGILVTILPQISFLLLKVMIIDAWSRYFVELLCRLVC